MTDTEELIVAALHRQAGRARRVHRAAAQRDAEDPHIAQGRPVVVRDGKGRTRTPIRRTGRVCRYSFDGGRYLVVEAVDSTKRGRDPLRVADMVRIADTAVVHDAAR